MIYYNRRATASTSLYRDSFLKNKYNNKIIRAENRAIRKKKSKNKVTPSQIPRNHVSVPSYIPSPPFRGGQ